MSERDKSELERGLQSLGRAFTGVTGRLLGPKAIGREELPPGSSISPEADAAIEKVGADLGRFLHATGEGLKAHPMDPSQALRTARASAEDVVEADPGWTPLAAGLKNLGGGLAKVAEGVLDVVAPRRPKDGAPSPAESDVAESDEEGGPGAA
ncbi:MAG: hypothetical protein V4850_04260 [Myxococcota bacterium]